MFTLRDPHSDFAQRICAMPVHLMINWHKRMPPRSAVSSLKLPNPSHQPKQIADLHTHAIPLTRSNDTNLPSSCTRAHNLPCPTFSSRSYHDSGATMAAECGSTRLFKPMQLERRIPLSSLSMSDRAAPAHQARFLMWQAHKVGVRGWSLLGRQVFVYWCTQTFVAT